MVNFRSLGVKTAVFFIVFAFLPITFLTVHMYRLMRLEIEDDIHAKFHQTARGVGRDIDRTVTASVAHIKALAHNPIMESWNSSLAEKKTEMLKIQQFYRVFDEITLINIDGKVLLSTSYSYRGEWKNKLWFKEALYGRASLSPVHVVPRPNRVVYVVTAPIMDQQGFVTGVVAGRVNMETIWETTDRIVLGKTGRVMLVNMQGGIVACPDRNLLFSKVQPDFLREALLRPGARLLHYRDLTGKKMIAHAMLSPGFNNYPGRRWKVVVYQEESEAFRLVEDFRRQVMIFFVLACIFLAVFVCIVWRQVIRRIMILKGLTEKLARGDRDTTIQVKGNDEIAQLGLSFNQLTDALRTTTASRDELSREITERKRVEVELMAAKRTAEEANRMKSQFLANVSHEIRTPLNGIIGFTEALIEENANPVITEKLRTVLRESETLLTLINDLLDHAKIEAGKIDLCYDTFSVKDLLERLRIIMDFRTKEKGLTFNVVVDDGVPGMIISDELRIRQILINLVGNAVKFTDHGGVTVRVTLQGLTAENARIRFLVIDTGIGIPKDRQARIFEEFTQADSSTTRKYGGTGLGTTISQRLVQLMHGKLGLESEEGKGSTFWFELTAGIPRQTEPPGAIEPQPRQGTTAQVKGDLAQARILLVEDYPPSQAVVKMHIERAGGIVDVAENGKEAVDACTQVVYDLILMDVQMPIMDGYEATRRIRAMSERGRTVAIIGLTANADLETRNQCMKAGMNEVLSKPVRRTQFLEMLQRWLSS